MTHIVPNHVEKKSGKLLEYKTIAEDGVISAKHKFYPGQILYSKIRPYLSKVVIVDFTGLCSADMYPIETELDTRLLWYYSYMMILLWLYRLQVRAQFYLKSIKKNLPSLFKRIDITEIMREMKCGERYEIKDILDSEQIHEFYSLRWQVEIVFKTWKSMFRMRRLSLEVKGLEASEIKVCHIVSGYIERLYFELITLPKIYLRR